jgi:phosphoserine phosphatase
MLELAETPVAAYPDAKLQHIAQEKGWRIIGT